jgi:hypothetical protein
MLTPVKRPDRVFGIGSREIFLIRSSHNYIEIPIYSLKEPGFTSHHQRQFQRLVKWGIPSGEQFTKSFSKIRLLAKIQVSMNHPKYKLCTMLK